MNENKVLATVNDNKITREDVNGLIQSLGPQRAQQFQSPEGEKTLINELINQNLFLLDAKDKNLDKEELYLEQIEKIKANVLSQYAIQKKLSGITLDEGETRKYYEENKDEFMEQESVKASHILVDDEISINRIAKEIEDGMRFEEAALKNSKCPSAQNGGDLGFFTKGKMVPEFEEASFKMAVGEIGKPIKTQFGYHIIKVTDKKEHSKKDFEEIKEPLSKQIMSMKQNNIYLETCKNLKEKYTVKIMD